MKKTYICIYPSSARHPVPNEQPCPFAKELKSCSDCNNYYDPRDEYGNNDGGKCVWVPTKRNCHPKKYVISTLLLDFEEDCTGNRSNILQNRTPPISNHLY